MKTLILYFSATGNTEHGVRLIRRGIEQSGEHSSDLLAVKDCEVSSLENYDLLGFAAPVFAFKPALNLLQLVGSLPQVVNKPCFLFLTAGGYTCNAGRILQQKLADKGYFVIAYQEMICEDSWTIIRLRGKALGQGRPTAKEQFSLVEFGAALPAKYAEWQAGRLKPYRPKLRLNPLHFLSYFFTLPLLQRFFTIRIDEKKCTNCGICVERCPTGRITLDNLPKPKGKCIACYGCINGCPTNAIDGWFTKGKDRYRGLREEQKI